jgi:predicted permease
MADAVISRVAMTASYVALGYLLQRVGAVKRDDGVVMLKFVVQVTLPALLLHTLTHSGPLFGPGTPLVFMIVVLASAIVAGGSYLLHRRKPSYERGLLVGCATGVNLGTFAYPFLEAVWGPEGLRLAALYDIPNALIVFGVASAIFATEERNTRMEAKERSGKHQDGGVYEGEWTGMDASGNQYKQGVGVYTYPSGASYEGQWNNNVKEGYGVYKWAKGGSYAGEWKRGTFNGMGLRFLRSGKFKSGRFEEGEFVESMDMAKSDEAASKAADCSREARNAAEKSRGVQETNAQAAARIIAKTLTFPPMVALILAAVATSGGAGATAPGVSALPEAIAGIIAPLAAANRPLVLVTLGVLFQPLLPRLQMRVVANFLAAKYSLSLVAAAVATAFVPPGLGAIRFIFAAIVLMPVPSVCVQYAAEHDADAVLAGCLANYSQVVSLVFLCALGALSAAHDPTAANRWLMPACLAGGAAAVAGLGFAADKALAPVKMVFRGSVPGGAKEQAAKISKKMEISKPDPGDDGPAGSNGPTVASAVGAGMRRGSSVTGGRRVPRINTDRGWNQGGGGSIRGWNQTVANTSSRARPNVARASGPTVMKSTGVRVSAVPRPCFAFA